MKVGKILKAKMGGSLKGNDAVGVGSPIDFTATIAALNYE